MWRAESDIHTQQRKSLFIVMWIPTPFPGKPERGCNCSSSCWSKSCSRVLGTGIGYLPGQGSQRTTSWGEKHLKCLRHSWWGFLFTKQHKPSHTCAQWEERGSLGCCSMYSLPVLTHLSSSPFSWTVEEHWRKTLWKLKLVFTISIFPLPTC